MADGATRDQARRAAVDGGSFDGPTRFRSILFDGDAKPAAIDALEVPAFLADLNLDQVITSITAGREEYELEPYFYALPSTIETISYRHDVLRDLESPELRERIAAFGQGMRKVRIQFARIEKLHYSHQKEAWLVEAAGVYCDAVRALALGLADVDLRSVGFSALRVAITEYERSPEFVGLARDTARLKGDLANVRYGLTIHGNHVKVSRYQEEPDYSAKVERTFERFEQGTVKDHRVNFEPRLEMDHVEAQVLELVARLHPDVFVELADYCDCHHDFVDGTLVRFDREVQFYLAYLEHMERFRATDLRFCYPEITDGAKQVHADGAFDIALANTLAREPSPVIGNDFRLDGGERIIVVSGPNQGGKTTFARTFGQLHYLARLGVPVPAAKARLFLFDRLFTHFEREEDLSTLHGKLEDELVRIHQIFEQATADSVVIMNESFSSTTLHDALLLGTEVMRRLVSLDVLCVYVTFVDELVSLSDTVVSMVSTVVPEDPAVRTFKVVRRAPDGLAYAAVIAEKYGLTYERIRKRIGS